MSPFERAARAAIASRLSPETREDYTRTLNRWLAFCGDADPADPPVELPAAFRDAVAADCLPSTVRNNLAALSFVYKRLVAQRPAPATWNPFDPDALAWPPASTIGKTEALPPGVAEEMIAAAAADGTLIGVRDAAFMLLLHGTGLRRMSVVSLRRDKVFRRGDDLFARVKNKGSGDSEQVEVKIPMEAAAALTRWLDAAPRSTYAFPSRDGRSHINLATANKIIGKWAHAVGAEHVHPHRFRASFITEAFNAGQHWRDIQAAVHHADPRSTQRYDRGLRGGGVADAVADHRRQQRGRKDK